MRAYLAVFVSVFLAELGDKTQLATLFFAAEPSASRLGVFAASAGALCLSAALAVMLGSYVGLAIPVRLLRIAAGIAFMAIGAWMLLTRAS